jgi:hypothetical protein
MFGSDCGSTERHACPRVVEPVLERVGAEQERKRDRDRAHLVDGEVRDDRLAALRQDERHAVAAADAEAGEHVGQAIGLAREVEERVRGRLPGLVFPVQRETAAIVCPARGARVRDVEIAWNVPAMARVKRSVVVFGH